MVVSGAGGAQFIISTGFQSPPPAGVSNTIFAAPSDQQQLVAQQQFPSIRSPVPHAPPTPCPSPGVLLRSPAPLNQQPSPQPLSSPGPFHMPQKSPAPHSSTLTPVPSPSPNITPPAANSANIPAALLQHQALQAAGVSQFIQNNQLVQIIQSANGRLSVAPQHQQVVVRPKQPQLLPKPANGVAVSSANTSVKQQQTQSTANVQRQVTVSQSVPQQMPSQTPPPQQAVAAVPSGGGTQQILMNPMLSQQLLLNQVYNIYVFLSVCR